MKKKYTFRNSSWAACSISFFFYLKRSLHHTAKPGFEIINSYTTDTAFLFKAFEKVIFNFFVNHVEV